MFGYCIWSKLHKNHYYNELIKTIGNELNLKVYPAHITMNYNLSLVNSFYIYFKNNYKYLYCPINKVYQTNNKNFYALQLDLISDDIEKPLHISLAYRTDRSFTNDEVNYVNNICKHKLIYSADYINHIYNCNSINSDDWFRIY